MNKQFSIERMIAQPLLLDQPLQGFRHRLLLRPPPAGSSEAQDFYRRMAEQFKSFNPRAELGVQG